MLPDFQEGHHAIHEHWADRSGMFFGTHHVQVSVHVAVHIQEEPEVIR